MKPFQTMVDLAQSAEEIKKDMPAVVADKVKGPTYPYGLSVCLCEDVLKKLKMDGDLPAVGDMIHLAAMATVTCASQTSISTDGGSEVSRRIELQITHIALEDEDDENRGAKWYGTKEPEPGED